MPNGDKTFLFVLYICSAKAPLVIKDPLLIVENLSNI
jgi:hypothetical protein